MSISVNSNGVLNNKLPPGKVFAYARATQAMRYRALGWSYEEIARKCGYSSEQACYQAIRAKVKAGVREAAEDLIEAEKNHLNLLQKKAWKLIRSSDYKIVAQGINLALRVSQRRSRLLGLDSPTKIALIEEEAKRIAMETGLTAEEVLRQAEQIAAAASAR
jgi:hypothetical protein